MKVRDPVSGVEFDADSAVATREHAGHKFYFQSQEMVREFDAHPHEYSHPSEHDADEEHHEPRQAA